MMLSAAEDKERTGLRQGAAEIADAGASCLPRRARTRL